MAQSSTLNDLQFWQATTGESLRTAAQGAVYSSAQNTAQSSANGSDQSSAAEAFVWTSGSATSRRFPWLLLGVVALLYYLTARLGWLWLGQFWHRGLFFNGSLIGLTGMAALGYFCWRLTEDLGQHWQERQGRSGYEIQFSQPVFRFGEPMELCFRHFLKSGQPLPEGGSIRAQIYCEESTLGANNASETAQPLPTIPWQQDLGEVVIASPMGQAGLDPAASSQLVAHNVALEARFDCTIPPGLPIACSIDIPAANGEDYTRLEVKWWLRFEIALPGTLPYQKALPIAVRSEVVQ
jgi:hypothetical protein